MKRTIKLLSLLLSVLMITTMLAALPLSVDAAVESGETVGATGVQANIEKIKAYINKNYNYSVDGKMVIVKRTQSEGDYTFTFKLNNNDTLSFFTEFVNTYGVVFFISIDPFSTSSIVPSLRVYTGAFQDRFTASMNVNVSTYNPNTAYNVTFTSYTNDYSSSDIQSLTRSCTNASLEWYDYLLKSMVGVTLGDIGFGYYPPSEVLPTKITLNTSSVTLTAGNKSSLSATITPSNATNKTVYWSSSNPSVAGMQSGGVINAKAAGTCTITAKTCNGLTATCKVTVKAKTVAATGISLNPTSMTITAGNSKKIYATITPSNATNKSVYWSSSNPGVAGMQSGGVLVAKKAGTCTITGKTNNGKAATCKVTVKAKTVAATGISLNPTSMTITVGNSKKIYATITPSNATSKSVYWSSSNPGVAGMQSGGMLVAKKAGTCTITGKTNNGKAATCKVTVKAKSSGSSSSTSDYDWHLENNNKLINFIKSLATKQSSGDYALKQTIKSGSSGEVILVTAKASGGIKVEDYDYFYDDGIGSGYYYTKIEWDMAKTKYNATGYFKKYYTTLSRTDISASGAFNMLTYDGEQGSFPNVDYGRTLRGCINDTLDSLDTFCYCSELDYMRVYSLGFQGIPRTGR